MKTCFAIVVVDSHDKIFSYYRLPDQEEYLSL